MFINIITGIVAVAAPVIVFMLFKAYGRMSLFEQTVLFNYPLLFQSLGAGLLSWVWWISKLFI
jgi:hypothetical protein